MEDRKRTVFVVVIAFVLMLALLYSFGLNFLTRQPQLELADPDVYESSEPGTTMPGEETGILLKVTPTTVQSVIATLSRYESYSRMMTITYLWADGSQSETISVLIREDSGWKRIEIFLSSDETEHRIIGDDRIWLWIEDKDEKYESQVFFCQATEVPVDLLQHIPTYEDVLALDPLCITDAGYEEYNGQPCIFVETQNHELGYVYRYWVSEISGLLMATETEKSGKIVYRMTSNEVISPCADSDSAFVLPDGTVLFASH